MLNTGLLCLKRKRNFLEARLNGSNVSVMG